MHTQWARTIQGDADRAYHSVEFPYGPHNIELTAACGLTSRFSPRIGIRMQDRYCPFCLTLRIKEDQE